MRSFKSATRGSQGSGLFHIKATLFLLAGLMALSWPRIALAQVAISGVLAPVPPGAAPGGVMFLSATVKPRGLRPATVNFYLAETSTHGPNDILLATSTVRPLSLLLAPQSLQITAPVEPLVPPGLYFVLACTGNQCAASPGTIEIIGEGLSPTDQSPGTTSDTPSATEYFPERPGDGMTVGAPFNCPLSTHGQWPSSCVYVTTKKFAIPQGSGASGLMYCPADRPYPFQVAIGNDPLWLDKTIDTVPALTNAVSFTKYKINAFHIPYSYTGFNAQSVPPNRGYAAFLWRGCTTCGDGTGQVEFLCTNKPTNSAAE